MTQSSSKKQNSVIIVVCRSCQLVTGPAHSGEGCPGCSDTLPRPSALPSLDDEARFVGPLAFLKPHADKANASLEEAGLMSFRDHPTTEEILNGPVCCGWCGTRYASRPKASTCPRCAGLLPKPPGNEPGPFPPAVPRKMPERFAFNSYLKRNSAGLFVWFSLGLCTIGLLFIPLFPLGLACAYLSFIVPYRRVKALAQGKATLGVISRVFRNGAAVSQSRKNHKTSESSLHELFTVYYRFEVNGQLLEGYKSTNDPSVQYYLVGEPIWVVYCPKQLESVDLWPTLA